MKLSVTFLSLLPIVITHAFTPGFSANRAVSSSLNMVVTTGPNGKPAADKEEDLKLTRELLMGSFAGDDETPPSAATAEVSADDATSSPKKKKKKKSRAAAEMDISKLDIRVGVIQKVWAHEEADKLFCEEIDIGEEGGSRKVASGLRAHYSQEDLIGRRVCVLANLKSRKLVGFLSHGMVLCASSEDGDKVVFVDPPTDADIGERVVCEGFEGDPASENQVGKRKILQKVFPDLKTDADGIATYKGVALTAGSGKCIAELPNAFVS